MIKILYNIFAEVFDMLEDGGAVSANGVDTIIEISSGRVLRVRLNRISIRHVYLPRV